MSSLVPIATKLAKLLPRLASDQPGEIVATTRAIRRTLAGSGLDLHDLATAVDPPPPPRCSPPAARPADFKPAALLDFCLHAEHGAELTSREAEFLRTLESTAYYWRGGALVLTERQRGWLEAIYAKCRRSFDGGAR